MACAICRTRRPRRFCPGVRGDICSICCGREREVTVDCPLDCEYLQEAHQHEKPAALDLETIPNQDIRVTEGFLETSQDLVVFLGRALVVAAADTPGAADTDVRGALDGLVRTYRTLQSGVYYESRPQNPLAANIFGRVQEGLAEFRRSEPERVGMSKTRDGDVLKVLVFFQRVELDRNNGRPRGRAFLGALRHVYLPEEGLPRPSASSLILP